MLPDLKVAFRQLVSSPGFSAIAILIVALGIGAATAMFSTVNALILRPIALPHSDRLAVIYETNLSRNVPFFSCTFPNYADWTNRTHSWESLAALNWRPMNLTGDGEPELIQVRAVTANFLPTLGIATQVGRNFLPEEDQPGGARVALISAAFWQRRFNCAPDILNRTLTFDGTSYAIIGVTAPGQPLASDLEVAIPLALSPAQADRNNHETEVYGRLKKGITLEQADTELKTITAQIWAEHPEFDRGWSTRLVPFAREIVGDGIRQGLGILLGAVGLLLLIACANLSNLLLVRAAAQTHELAIRTALGAGRMAIVRKVVTESLVITLAGGALGLLVAIWATDAMHSLPLPRATEISVDFRVAAAALAATVLTAVFAGLWPALKATAIRPQAALKAHGPRSGRRSRLRDSMVVIQLAISLTLLVGVTLLGRSFLHLLQVNPGFTTENALTLSLRPADKEHAVRFYERTTQRISALPGVTGVGLISSLPLTDGNTSNNIFPVGPSVVPAGESIQSSWRLVDGGYFKAMQIPLVRGRSFDGLPLDEARRSVVLSASLARMLFGNTDPIGRQIDNLKVGGFRLTVIGVAGDVRSANLGTEPAATFYWSMHLFIYGPMNLVVRADRDIAPLLPSIRAAIKEIDPTVPLIRLRTLAQVRDTSLEQERLTLALLAGFTGAALLLAALGTYGVITFSVQQRTQEIGIRLAIGAQAGDILRLVLGEGFRLVALGIVLGVAGALATSRLLAAMLYQTDTADPWSYILATAVLALVALIAALLPARRAINLDPLNALRAE